MGEKRRKAGRISGGPGRVPVHVRLTPPALDKATAEAKRRSMPLGTLIEERLELSYQVRPYE